MSDDDLSTELLELLDRTRLAGIGCFSEPHPSGQSHNRVHGRKIKSCCRGFCVYDNDTISHGADSESSLSVLSFVLLLPR
jgi:hypothetical protein